MVVESAGELSKWSLRPCLESWNLVSCISSSPHYLRAPLRPCFEFWNFVVLQSGLPFWNNKKFDWWERTCMEERGMPSHLIPKIVFQAFQLNSSLSSRIWVDLYKEQDIKKFEGTFFHLWVNNLFNSFFYGQGNPAGICLQLVGVHLSRQRGWLLVMPLFSWGISAKICCFLFPVG